MSAPRARGRTRPRGARSRLRGGAHVRRSHGGRRAHAEHRSTNYGGLIAAERYSPAGFTPALGRKDVDLARTEAASTNLQLPTADLLSRLLTESIETGHAGDDSASLAAVQRRRDLDEVTR